MRSEIYPAILTHNLEEYIAKLELVESSVADWVQIDVMDGQFVPNITVMPHEIMGIPTKLKMEVHLMTYAPERYFSDLTVAGISRVLLHREVYGSLDECNQALKIANDYFPEVGLVINPDTDIEDYSNLAISSIQCMGVHPGASGQPLLDSTYVKIEKIRAQGLPFVIAVDGGVNEDNIRSLQKAGVTRFVISSHLFATHNIAQNVQHFIQIVSGGI